MRMRQVVVCLVRRHERSRMGCTLALPFIFTLLVICIESGTPLTGLRDLWNAEPGATLVGLATPQAFTLRAFSPVS